jgi:hypothetical protein
LSSFLQPFRGRPCRGTPESHPWLSGPAHRPGFRSCWGRAGPAFSVGAPVVGRARAGYWPARPGPCSRSGPGASEGFDCRPGAAAGRPDLGMLGSARPVSTLPGHSLSAVSVCTVTAASPRARASGSLQADGTTPRRRRGAARWEPHGAAPPLLRWGSGPPFAPSSVLSRTWSWLSASSLAGAASVIEFSRFVALVPASSLST